MRRRRRFSRRADAEALKRFGVSPLDCRRHALLRSRVDDWLALVFARPYLILMPDGRAYLYLPQGPRPPHARRRVRYATRYRRRIEGFRAFGR